MDKEPEIVNNLPAQENSSGNGLLLAIIGGLGIMIIVLAGYAYYVTTNTVKEEPAPTVESFRKSYVAGCELKPTTFNFADGASLTGEFAECPAERGITFFATTTTLSIPSKKTLTIHHIMVRDKEVTYPVVSVYFPQDIINTQALAGTSTLKAVSATSSEITMADIGKSGTVVATASDGTKITWGTVILRGYFMALYSKTSGYLFDQSSLKYNEVLN